MEQLQQPIEVRPYTRSPLLLAAYGAILAALVNLVLGSGLIWTGGSAALAVLLALAAILVQIRRAGARPPNKRLEPSRRMIKE